jgi:iron complex outermembrane receptor protein
VSKAIKTLPAKSYGPTWARKKSYALALAVAGACAGNAYAQDDEAASSGLEEEEVVVTGMRQSLISAQDIKRNSGTVVDSIDAKDLGSFPDKSIAEALQRVAGITVNRFAASSDTAHFSAEPSGVIVRGLQFVRNEFNGRDTFSANSSRGLSWTDVSPELLAGADTYKNQMAELIEGGIAGSVNLRTRVPFDQDGLMFAANVRMNYNDLAEESKPELSALYSNRWMTDGGEFGFMANVAFSDVTTRSQGVQQYRQNRFRNFYPESTTADPDDYHGLTYVPAIINMRDNFYFRERTGVALAAQWQNTDETMVFTSQYNRSEYENAWEERVVQSFLADQSFGQSLFFETVGPYSGNVHDNNAAVSVPGTDPFTFDENGHFQTGVVATGHGWWGGSPADSAVRAQNGEGEAFVNNCYSWQGCYTGDLSSLRGVDVGTISRASVQTNITEDLSFNFKWSITDSIRANFDLQRVESTVENYDIEVGFKSQAVVDVDLTGDRARAQWLPTGPTDPETGEPLWENGGPATNLSPGIGGSNPYNNPSNYWTNYLMDHVEDSEGEQTAFRADFEFDIEAAGVESIKTGLRWAERDQRVNNATYNWQNVANTWTDNQSHYFNVNRHDPAPEGTGGPQTGFTGYPTNYYETATFSGDWWGLDGEYVFPNMDLIKDQELLASTMSAQTLGLVNGTGWDPMCSNTGDRASEVAGTCFTPAEIANITEETLAGYWQVNFGDGMEFFGIPVSGNVGVRYVQTELTSSGGLAAPQINNQNFYSTVTQDDPDAVYPEGHPNAGDPYINPLTGNPFQENIRTQYSDEEIAAAYAAGNPETLIGCEQNQVGYEIDDAGDLVAVVLPAVPATIGCYLSADDILFSDNGDITSTEVTTHHNILPSFNIKFDLTDDLVGRFALSRSMSRPNMANLRNYVGIGLNLPSQSDSLDPLWERDGAGNIVGATPYYRGSAQNPYLAPVLADGMDFSLEWYFAEGSSLTGTVFKKWFKDYITTARYFRTVENRGITRQVDIQGPVNGDGASLSGAELAYTHWFDFLPEPFDGLGIQANYTYINNEGIENTNVTLGQGSTNITGQAPDSVSVGGLESLSENGYNFVVMYEKGDIQSRLAWSWRSEYIVTVVDCCVAYPVVHDDYGQLDGSFKWTVNDNFELSLSGSNLTNSETVTYQQVENIEDGGLLLPTGNFQNGRTFTLGVSYKY